MRYFRRVSEQIDTFPAEQDEALVQRFENKNQRKNVADCGLP